MSNINKLSSQHWNFQQSWNYESIWNINGYRVAIHIRVNAFADQSFAVAKVFSHHTVGWNELAAVPVDWDGYRKVGVTHIRPEVAPTVFAGDEKKLVDKAALILEP